MRHGVSWQIGGTAGEGLESAGDSLARALAVIGYRPSTGRDFPSRIRGGDTTFTVRLTAEGHLVPPERIDLALAFNDSVLPRMDAGLGEGSLLLVDEGVGDFVSGQGAEVVHFDFTGIAREAGLERAKNVVALGVSAALLGLPLDELAEAVAQRFAHKGDEVVAQNRDALLRGHGAAVERFGESPRFEVPARESGEAFFLSGNQAACLGALTAGCRIAAAYPITPASDVLEFLTPRLAELGGQAVQMEDEMAALNLCIGAGFTGARALTATSGPGLSLMTETLALAGATETPVVILDCQRPGPSTGMPTKHGQEDLWHMVHGGHGEDVRVVLAPTDVGDAFHATSEAFRLAAAFRCPAIVALDQQASLMMQTVAPFDLASEAERQGTRTPSQVAADASAWTGSFQPYGDDAPSLPGEPGLWYANSTEHGPDGFTTEDPGVRSAMVERRLARLQDIVAEVKDAVMVEGPEDAEVVLVSWGSTVEACREAAARTDRPVRVVAVRLLWPLPVDVLRRALGGDAPVLCVEANAMGQLASLLRSELPLHDRMTSVLRYDGTPVRSGDILEAMP